MHGRGRGRGHPGVRAALSADPVAAALQTHWHAAQSVGEVAVAVRAMRLWAKMPGGGCASDAPCSNSIPTVGVRYEVGTAWVMRWAWHGSCDGHGMGHVLGMSCEVGMAWVIGVTSHTNSMSS